MKSNIFVFALLLMACGHQSPQIPSRRMGAESTVDSTTMVLMETNRRLALAADNRLLQYVQQQQQPFALYENSTWVCVIDRGEDSAPMPLPEQQWIIHMRIMNLNEQMLEDNKQTYRIAKNELPAAVETVIQELHRGAKARLVAPWYMAFGMQGSANIPPYENVIIDLELE